ncbi:hypothetical protein TNCV_2022471 [Trichonephila clavipes]|nr:hypothetical protein TNCV_2022471 [Trichonephila clavipes]
MCPDCPDHSSLESKNNETIKDNVKINELDKKTPQKRKNTKNNTDDFVFLSKTARPTTPTSVLEPVVTQNSFENLEQDTEPHINQIQEIPTPKPPPPIFLSVSSVNEQRPLAACKEKRQWKDELKIVAEELNLTVPEGAKIAGLKNLIVNSDAYKNDKELVQSAIDYALAEIKNKRLDSETKLEFERIKLA